MSSPAPTSTPIMIAVFVLFPPPPPLSPPPPLEGELSERDPPLFPDGEDLLPLLSPLLEGGEPRDGGDSLPPPFPPFPPPPCDAGEGGELLLELWGEGACGAGGEVESGGGDDESPWVGEGGDGGVEEVELESDGGDGEELEFGGGDDSGEEAIREEEEENDETSEIKNYLLSLP